MKTATRDTTLKAAMESAQGAADLHHLPQTVYRNAESGGWWHTHPFAGVLMERGCEVHVTLLNDSYFN